jgi:hypothetical protein
VGAVDTAQHTAPIQAGPCPEPDKSRGRTAAQADAFSVLCRASLATAGWIRPEGWALVVGCKFGR